MSTDRRSAGGSASSPRSDDELIAAALQQEAAPAARGVHSPPPVSIGPYRIVRPIGSGGMGVVYEAEQERPLRRRVALKVIKLGMDTREVVRRFETERQALALMDHPNIARVFDAGATEQGRPYFVMECVPGVRITRYCDEYGLSIPERLSLVVQVCHAIQHAHQKGVIHRDIKPSNVLVTVLDDRPVPKVIDFGVAKAVEQHAGEQSLVTEPGQPVGTPAYMSPEQLGLGGSDVDTRSDIYSLGLLLYDLLVGVLPYAVRSAEARDALAWHRTLANQEPVLPSTRLGSLGGDALDYAERRCTSPSALRRALRGDLDWITMKALEKDRTRRYATAAELAADIERYLRHEPVSAGPPGTAYRVRMFVRRNRGLVASGAVVLGVLIAGIIASTAFALKASRAEKDARWRAYRGNIAGANAALVANQTGTAQRLLNEAPEEHRGWEWHYLSAAADQSLAILPHDSDVWAIAFSPDGSLLVSGAEEGPIRIWDVASRRLLRTLEGHTGCVYSVAFSPNGCFLASGSKDETIRIWDMPTGTVQRVLQDPPAQVFGVAFSPNGRYLAAGRSDLAVRIWDLTTGQVWETPLDHGALVYTVAFHPTLDLLASGDGVSTADGLLRLWDLAVVPPAPRAAWGYTGFVRSVAFSPDGARLAVGAKDGTLCLWNVGGGILGTEKPTVLLSGSGVVQCAAFSHDGLCLASGTDDSIVRLWSVTTGEELAALHGHGGIVQAVAFSPDGRLLASAGRGDRCVRLWDPALSAARDVLRPPSRPGAPAFSRDGRLVATLRDNVVRTWDTFNGEPHGPARVLPSRASVLSWDTTRCALLTSDVPGRIRIVDVYSQRIVWELYGHAGTVCGLSFSVDGQRLASCGADGTLRIWDLRSGTELRVLGELGPWPLPAVFSPDGRRIAVVTREDLRAAVCVLRIWDVASGDELRTGLRPGDVVAGVSFSPDGGRVAYGSAAGTITIWNLEANREERILRGHTGGIYWTVYSPDGCRLVSTSEDHSVRIWDVATGEELLLLPGHEDIVYSAVFSSDGTLLATASDDKTIRLWDSVPYRDRLREYERLSSSAAKQTRRTFPE